MSKKMYEEQEKIQYDKKYYDVKKKKLFNKKARYNIVFADEKREASEDYEQFTVAAFSDCKYLNKMRKKIHKAFGPKAK